MTLNEELGMAWADRARDAADRHRVALSAPALFRPDHVASLADEYHVARTMTAYWMDGPGS